MSLTPIYLEPLRADQFEVGIFINGNEIDNLKGELIDHWKLSTSEQNYYCFEFDLKNYVSRNLTPKDIVEIDKITIRFFGPAKDIVRVWEIQIERIGFEIEGAFEKDNILNYNVKAYSKSIKEVNV